MLPPQQRLKPDNPSGIQRHDRLIEIAKFLAFQSATQVRLQLQARHYAGAHVRVENFKAGLTQRFGPIHSRVRVAKHVLRLVVGRIAQGDSDAYRREYLFPTQDERRG